MGLAYPGYLQGLRSCAYWGMDWMVTMWEPLVAEGGPLSLALRIGISAHISGIGEMAQLLRVHAT